MELSEIRANEITGAFYVYSKKGVKERKLKREYYAVTFCDSGKISYEQDGKKTVSDTGHIIILPKNGDYTIIRQETGYFPVINFDSDRFITDKIQAFEINSKTEFVKIFFEIKEACAANDMCKALSLFYKILSQASCRNYDIISKITQYIADNISDCSVSNKTIADEMNISESYLNKLFRVKYNTSVKKYIISRRIDRAKQLIFENHYSITQICEMCGYGNIYSFSRAFKEITGYSPMSYKKTTNI